MILNPKFQVGDRVHFHAPSKPLEGKVVEIEAYYCVRLDNGEQHHLSERQLRLMSRPCKHTKGYYPQGGAASSDWVTFAHCPNCGEEL